MNHRISALSMAILAGLFATGSAMAQDSGATTPTPPAKTAKKNTPATPDAANPQAASNLEGVTVTGIRASLQKSLDLKRNADSIVDAISAEDVGKFPDTNVAESLSHLPGISVDRNFGEGDKVSILGTDPALNRLLLNGQTLASTNWTSDPNNPDSRSFDYSLLTSEIIGNAQVYKTPQAKIDEGSIGGTVVVNTRRPLDLKANTLTGNVSYGYNDRADKGKPNASLFYSWKNDANTFGVLGSVMHSDRVIDRQGTEIFGYQRVNDPTDTNPSHQFAPGVVAPNAQGVYPTAINTAWFQQERKRDGVSTGLQWKPNDGFELNFTGLYVTEKFNNFNQSRYGDWSGSAASANSLGFNNGVATNGSYGAGAPSYLDGYERFSKVNTGTAQLRADWYGDGWTASSQVGYTGSTGGSNGIYSAQFQGYGGYNWNLAGQHPQINYNSPDNPSQMLAHGAGYSYAPSYDRERYFQADFAHDVSWGPLNQIEVGIKATNHYNGQDGYAAQIPSPDGSGVSLADLQGGMTPDGYLGGLNGTGSMANWTTISRGGLKDYVQSLVTSVPLDPKATYSIQEQNRAFYIQGDFAGDSYRGNLGMRYYRTRDTVDGYNSIGTNQYAPVNKRSSYHDWLPSFNIAYDLRDDLVLRFAAAKAIARPRYQQMTPYVALDDRTLTGSEGNTDLKPYKSTNYDASLEWYFSENSVLSAEAFYRRISGYILNTNVEETHFNLTTLQDAVYSMEKPINAGVAKVKGLSLTYQGNFGYGFGMLANYTYSHADTSNSFPLPYNSKNSFNLSPYYEQGPWNARITYSWRSAYFTQIAQLQSAQITGIFRELDASVGYQINDHIRVSLDATNLLDETYFVYNNTPSQPLNAYKNGRTYTLNLGFKL
ncbi:iron complex outermembrane receptor protein [Luteibacter rhizovicinus]|uniref:Iron complex outermembrane receptor protein n=1 Tax=Luteibacter rhizovicinus TaxID=242606 RepID=A0A4R3YLL8_9GAMM|nr:TonB-dependent receptor [Luteibacter rhizovicinus]TCV93176.1 iron complex outermembrane receptor protein [Luteibacter rhizovicinus]